MGRVEVSPAARAGFEEDGKRYTIHDPRMLSRADSDLWNDRMYLQIDHRGRCDAFFLQPEPSRYSENSRWFYLRDEETGKFRRLPFDAAGAEPERFAFSAGIGDVAWRIVADGIEVSLRLVVPRDDTVELWTATLKNLSQRKRRIAFYNYFPTGTLGSLRDVACFDAKAGAFIHDHFWWWTAIPEYFKTRGKKNMVFCAPDCRPTSFESNANDFIGELGPHDPRQLHQKRLGRGEALSEPAAAIFQFVRTLDAGRSRQVNFVFGPAKDRREISRLKRKYLCKKGIEKALAKVGAFHGKYRAPLRMKTPDRDLDHFVNHWLPRRLLLMGRTLRMMPTPSTRNAIQDAMGLSYFDPDMTRRWFARIWAFQHFNGRLQHNLPMAEGLEISGLGLIPHKDKNVWGPMALDVYMRETGDLEILDLPLPFADSEKKTPLYDHICRGLDWLLRDRTRRGLSRIGEGDWNDPLNMAGWRGRGESTWLTEALVYSLELWAGIAERIGDAKTARRYRREAERSRKALNRYAWDGAWYARGFKDDGLPFGVRKDREGMIYLNAQSWAILAGAARGERLEACIESVTRYLRSPSGPMTLFPTYSRMKEDIGKISMKAPGVSENGSVYCHAATFYAFALFSVRKTEEAWDVLRNLLTGSRKNPLERSGQLPLYIPNLYRGTAAGKTAGRSSHEANTGTAPWYYRAVLEMLIGARAEYDGLRVDPQLPEKWNRVKAVRRFRDTVFEIEIRKDTNADGMHVELDGKRLRDNLIPVQRPGSRHEVRVFLGV